MKRKLTKIGNIPVTNKITKLEELVRIRSGYTHRKKVEAVEDGNAYHLQMSDLNHDLKLLKEIPTKIKMDNPYLYQVAKGDILFLAKGTNNYAMLFEGLELPTVPASTFFILSPKSNDILATYLTWYINQTPAQRYLDRTLEGTNQRNINRSSLLDLEVVLPPRRQQELIGKLYQLGKKEKQLLQTLISKRQQLLQVSLLNTIGL